MPRIVVLLGFLCVVAVVTLLQGAASAQEADGSTPRLALSIEPRTTERFVLPPGGARWYSLYEPPGKTIALTAHYQPSDGASSDKGLDLRVFVGQPTEPGLEPGLEQLSAKTWPGLTKIGVLTPVPRAQPGTRFWLESRSPGRPIYVWVRNASDMTFGIALTRHDRPTALEWRYPPDPNVLPTPQATMPVSATLPASPEPADADQPDEPVNDTTIPSGTEEAEAAPEYGASDENSSYP